MGTERAFLLQHGWQDGTTLLDTSATQLRSLQARHRQVPHKATQKWEIALSSPLPVNVWMNTWLPYRGTSENTFMWQLLYRVIATQHWRSPSTPATDPDVWCTRCNLGIMEDTEHCVWSCPISATCWQWGNHLLRLSASNREANIVLRPEHIFIASPLSDDWRVPDRLWQILKAVLCWQIWKNLNAHFMAGKPATTEKVIRKAWHRLGMYIRKEWRFLGRKIEADKITVEEAQQLMLSRFGACPLIWNLHGLTLQIPPVPPRPP